MTVDPEYTEGLKFLRRERGYSVYEVKRTTFGNGAFGVERLVGTESIMERVVWTSYWQETVRVACFCCTCDPYSGTTSADAACRNHGFYGSRPCDIHNLPGYPWEGTDEMPESVLTIRQKQKEAHEKAQAEGKRRRVTDA